MKLTKTEIRATFSLASILSIRMLGLFMILPIFTLYTEHLRHATPFLIGIALGIYGLFQALLQMPFGLLSDRIGRKTVIALGLFIFIIGSVIAALSTNIYGIILGRALQGAAAIGSTLIAFIADFTRTEHRTKAMAIMGMTIGLSFATAMVLGPLLNAWIHLAGIFWVCSLLGIAGLVILFTTVPPAPNALFHRDAEPVPGLILTMLHTPQLLKLYIGIGCLHAILTASFVAMPIFLTQRLELAASQQWQLYLIILLLSFVAMIALIVIAEKKQLLKQVILAAIALLALSELLFWKGPDSYSVIAIGLLIFFIGFNVLEACLPSLISRTAPSKNRGTVMGIFSTCQFLGIFIGGTAGGLILQHLGIQGIFAFCLLLAVIWWGMAATKLTAK